MNIQRPGELRTLIKLPSVLLPLIMSAVSLVASDSTPDNLARLQRALEAAMTQRDMNIASGEIGKYWERELENVEERILSLVRYPSMRSFLEARRSCGVSFVPRRRYCTGTPIAAVRFSL